MNVGAAVTAADAGEGGNGVSIAVTVTDKKFEKKNFKMTYTLEVHIITDMDRFDIIHFRYGKLSHASAFIVWKAMHKYCFILQLCYLFFENLLNDKDSQKFDHPMWPCLTLVLPVWVSVADCVMPGVLLLIPCHIKTDFLPIPFTLLSLTLSRNVALRGSHLWGWRMGDGG